jgi:hypothetical protein
MSICRTDERSMNSQPPGAAQPGKSEDGAQLLHPWFQAALRSNHQDRGTLRARREQAKEFQPDSAPCTSGCPVGTIHPSLT